SIAYCYQMTKATQDILQSLFSFNATAPTEISTLSLHDALPIFAQAGGGEALPRGGEHAGEAAEVLDQLLGQRLDVAARNGVEQQDRKSTRLNSSHVAISYAVFCLKKKK